MDDFWRDGYIILRAAFSQAEIDLVRRAVVQCQRVIGLTPTLAAAPAFATISVWNDTSGSDILSRVTRSQRIMDRVAGYLDDDVYLYHNKVTLKLPGVIGFPFHQDYAYWYSMGCLYPDMATAYVAIDAATLENGCMKVIRGSHRLGRVDHIGHEGIEDARLEQILSRMEVVAVTMQPGDVLIFHCNTFHGSDRNASIQPRLSLLGCYNTKHNSPYMQAHGHPYYTQQSRFTGPVEDAPMPQF